MCMTESEHNYSNCSCMRGVIAKKEYVLFFFFNLVEK